MMLFDAGQYGMIEVDMIIDKGDRVVGLVNPHDDYKRVAYINWGKKRGCSLAYINPPEDMSPEARKAQRQRIIDTAMRIVNQWDDEYLKSIGL